MVDIQLMVGWFRSRKTRSHLFRISFFMDLSPMDMKINKNLWIGVHQSIDVGSRGKPTTKKLVDIRPMVDCLISLELPLYGLVTCRYEK